MPLCYRCHLEQGAGEETWERKHGLNRFTCLEYARASEDSEMVKYLETVKPYWEEMSNDQRD